MWKRWPILVCMDAYCHLSISGNSLDIFLDTFPIHSLMVSLVSASLHSYITPHRNATSNNQCRAVDWLLLHYWCVPKSNIRALWPPDLWNFGGLEDSFHPSHYMFILPREHWLHHGQIISALGIVFSTLILLGFCRAIEGRNSFCHRSRGRATWTTTHHSFSHIFNCYRK